jgi:hypothetical protein
VLKTDILQITLEIRSLIARIDEFKGAWRALGTLARLVIAGKGRIERMVGRSAQSHHGCMRPPNALRSSLSGTFIRSLDQRIGSQAAQTSEPDLQARRGPGYRHRGGGHDVRNRRDL